MLDPPSSTLDERSPAMTDPQVRPVSADSHVNPHPEMWAEYLPSELREQAPRVERTDEGDFEVFEGARKPMVGLTAAAGRTPQEYSMTVRRFSEVRAGGWEPGPRVADQEIDGVDAEVLYGVLGAPLKSKDPRLERAGYTAYNRWMADFCAYAPTRLVGLAYVPCDDVDDALAEIRASAALGLRGAVIPHEPGTGRWDGDEWAPLWNLLVELEWPASFHVGGSHFGIDRSTPPGYMNAMVASKLQMPLTLGQLVMGGVLVRHPELKVVSVEGQIGWIPFWKYYLDHVYEKHRWHQELHFDERPSHYIERQVYYTFMEDPPGIDERHACGVGRIMWSNDYPHSETTWPHSQKIIGEIFEHVPADETRRIVRDNCVELYRLD
jgi:predicted TIM-barrel fold metal-dependent hydrolase